MGAVSREFDRGSKQVTYPVPRTSSRSGMKRRPSSSGQRTRTKALQLRNPRPIYRLSFRDCVINGRFSSSEIPENFI